jgi:hypothetical protein
MIIFSGACFLCQKFIYIRPLFNLIIQMKKLIFGTLALALFTVTSCRDEKTEAAEEIAKETAINEPVNSEISTEEQDSLEVEMETEVDSLETVEEVNDKAPAIQ